MMSVGPPTRSRTPRLAAMSMVSGLAEMARHRLVTVLDAASDGATVADALLEAARPLDVPAPILPTWSDCADDLRTLYDEVLARRP